MNKNIKNIAEKCRYCCYSGYHNWFCIEDDKGRDVYRICSECGRVEKLFDEIYQMPIPPQEVIGEEKEMLISRIEFIGFKYKLLKGG